MGQAKSHFECLHAQTGGGGGERERGREMSNLVSHSYLRTDAYLIGRGSPPQYLGFHLAVTLNDNCRRQSSWLSEEAHVTEEAAAGIKTARSPRHAAFTSR